MRYNLHTRNYIHLEYKIQWALTDVYTHKTTASINTEYFHYPKFLHAPSSFSRWQMFTTIKPLPQSTQNISITPSFFMPPSSFSRRETGGRKSFCSWLWGILPPSPWESRLFSSLLEECSFYGAVFLQGMTFSSSWLRQYWPKTPESIALIALIVFNFSWFKLKCKYSHRMNGYHIVQCRFWFY